MSQTGVQESESPLHELEDEDWDATLARNLGTCCNLARAVLPGMIRWRYGRIVNLASVTGRLVSNPG
jgi:3-oxoacyl-[acyl-carrier protein] reductase